jgi:polycomb group RING finger protein 3
VQTLQSQIGGMPLCESNAPVSRNQPLGDDSGTSSSSDEDEIGSIAFKRVSCSVSGRKINEFTVCKICSGYFIDAQTISECLHTFCKRCLFKFKPVKQCPICKICLKSKTPFKPDRIFQSIVDKIFPHFPKGEQSEKEMFYARRGIKRKISGNSSSVNKKKRGINRHVDKEMNFKLKSSKTVVGKGDEICFQLVPVDKSLNALIKPYLRTSGKLRTIHLVKYLRKKLNLSVSYKLEILCNGEVVGKEHNLTFLKRSRWHQREHLILHYRVEKELL